MTNKEQAFMQIASEVAKGGMESVTYVTECRMRKTNNPYFGRVTKMVKASGLQFGADYSHLKSVDLNGQAPQPLKGCNWVLFPIILQSQVTGKLQLRCSLTANTKFNTTYFVDGVQATEKQINEFKPFISPSEKPSVFNITIEKVIGWKVGGKTFSETKVAM